MVKYMFVTSPAAGRPSKPIGVLTSLAVGFDRVASRPLLIAPPLLLDLLLWLGPRLRITALIQQVARSLEPPAGVSEALRQQLTLLQERLTILGEGFNLISGLSSLPVGIPSLMAGRMPRGAPLSLVGSYQVSDPLLVLSAWLGFSLLGFALGGLYQYWLARTLVPGPSATTAGSAAVRVLLFSVLLILVLGVAGGVALLIAGLATALLPLLGAGVMFLGFTLFFWVVVYLAFTPHGIIRYNFGVVRAMIESFLVVRWNTLSVAGFLALALGVYWLSNMVWGLPGEETWFALLAILGHAFVSATLLMASYAFYQGRREWMVAYRRSLSRESAHWRDQRETES